MTPSASLSLEAEKILWRKNEQNAWPPEHIIGADGQPVPFHRGQYLAWESIRRFTGMIAGSQGGKTVFGPWWLSREIEQRGSGDYLAVTANYDLFKLRMLPALLEVFEQTLRVARYWPGNRILELKNPETGQFHAKRADDAMWGRVILRSADALGGLEAATAKGAWLDEAGQDRFTYDAWKAIRRRLALHSGRVLITTTLYNLGWVVQEVIDKVESGVSSIETYGKAELEYTDCEETDTALVQFDSILNPTYPLEEFEDARTTLPDDEFQMFYRGRKATLRFLIYDCLDRARHVVPRFPIPKDWSRYLGLDFGGENTAGMFYAEEPETKRLYCYREYLHGKRTSTEHAKELLRDEPGIPFCVGGSKSEGQWRREFAQGGLPVIAPSVKDVNLGINRVYGQHKQDGIIYFEDLRGVLDEKGRYRRKRDKLGNVTDEIESKSSFHRLDAERYIIGYIRSSIERRRETVTADAKKELVQPSRWSTSRSPRWKRTRR